MNLSSNTSSPLSFTAFGDLLKYLRRRARFTQLELSIAVGYSEAQKNAFHSKYADTAPTVTINQAALFIALGIGQR